MGSNGTVVNWTLLPHYLLECISTLSYYSDKIDCYFAVEIILIWSQENSINQTEKYSDMESRNF